MSDAPAFEVGDRVAMRRSGRAVAIATVDRLTPTQVIVGRRRFRRDDGREIGGSDGWRPESIAPATQADIDEVRHRRLAARIDRIDWQALPLEKLEAVAAILGIASESPR